jgi:hypothetical protein
MGGLTVEYEFQECSGGLEIPEECAVWCQFLKFFFFHHV